MDIVLVELTQSTPKDTHRKVCKHCHELGHGISSICCIINVNKKNRLKNQIMAFAMKQDCSISGDEICREISIQLGISFNSCQSMYQEISPLALLDRPMNLSLLECETHQCSECTTRTCCETGRLWKNELMCDLCWLQKSNDRERLWKEVHAYRQPKCVICLRIKQHFGERFHYDHLNMFDKADSICSMINNGTELADIYIEIDKCQVLCISCHHKVTKVENHIGFTRIKKNLTRRLNQNEITQEEYIFETKKYQDIYKSKMMCVYHELSTIDYKN